MSAVIPSTRFVTTRRCPEPASAGRASPRDSVWGRPSAKSRVTPRETGTLSPSPRKAENSEKEKVVLSKTTPCRLLLTSSGLTTPSMKRSLRNLLKARKSSGNPKVVYIVDGIVGNGGSAAQAHQSICADFASVGVRNVACVELKNTSPEKLANCLNGVDCIYVDQGNTFYLRYQMRTSGFDTLVGHLVRETGVVYVGASSGSICAGRTISVAFWKGWDNPGFGTPWDLSNVGYAGLDLIPGGKSLFPHFNANWKSLVQEKRKELDHDVVVLDESTAYTADEDDDTSSSAASSTPTPPTSQARKGERPPLSPGRPGPYPVRRVPTPFFDWTAPRTSRSSGFSVSPIRSSTADPLHPVTWGRV